MKRQQQNSQQYNLDFTSRTNDRCSMLAMLRDIPMDVSPGRLSGVVELLQRLTVLARDLPESLHDSYAVVAQVTAIAARIRERQSVTDRTVRNWTTDALDLGLLARVEYRSQMYGGRNWNIYHVSFAAVMSLLSAGNGRKRAESISAPGAETISGPGAESISAPKRVKSKSQDRNAPRRRACESDHACDSQEEEVSRLIDLFKNSGVWSADDEIPALVDQCGVDYLKRLLAYYEAHRDTYGPGALCLRLRRSRPLLAVEEAWPPTKRHVAAMPLTQSFDGKDPFA